MSKFSKWKKLHPDIWGMLLVPMIVGAIAIPSAVIIVCVVMNVAFVRKVVFAVGCCLGAILAVYMVGIVLCLLWGVVTGLLDELPGRGSK